MGKTLKTILLLLLSFVLGMAFCVAAINVSIQHFAGGYILNAINKKAPELFKRDISVEGVGVYLIKGEIALRGARVESYEGVKERPVIFIEEIKLRISLKDLINNKLVIEKCEVIKPVLNFDSGGMSGKDSVLSYLTGLRSLGIGPKNLYVKGGSFVFYRDYDNAFTILSGFEMAVENMPVDSSVSDQQVKASVSAQIPSVKPGSLLLNLKFTSFYPKYNFSGEFSADGIYIPYFAGIFSESGDIAVMDGNLDIKTNIHCSENWVTAGSLITMNKLDLSITSKKIFGIPADEAEKFLKANDVSFNLPVSGDINNLKYDFKTASAQVMYKALQGRFKSDSFTKRIAESFGGKIGAKLEEIFSKLF